MVTLAFKTVSKEYPNYGKSVGLPLKTWWTRIIRLTFKDYAITDEACNALYEHFNTANAYHIFPDGMQLISNLGPAGFNLGILSNSDPRMRVVLERTGFLKYLKTGSVFLSYETGFEKPAPEAFHLASQIVNATAPHAGLTVDQKLNAGSDKNLLLWHVGDDVDKDYKGALNCGWNSILVDRNAEFLKEKTALDSYKDASGYHYYSDKTLTVVSSGSEPVRVYTSDMSRIAQLFE
ncbi:hypothetical protein AWJ20_1955 [Sugiyamaella lignohabitans]|uniref:Uncharacterized protein n=1 Tax=Sugiyamaella lignohabitans TaxID=796027 RepID=A0A167E5B2_9ASCO|nr:uncharacterized protein AWJ20_1955 [Sugiyamaella lignohabitans]ANB13656.1 hypothetical protein AWJ20_1955 [Sugiyamaella lignohabitans]